MNKTLRVALAIALLASAAPIVLAAPITPLPQPPPGLTR